MPLRVDGVLYLSAAELEEELDVSRQTMWRWRKDGHIPQGRRFRGSRILFTAGEAKLVRAYATRIEPIGDESIDQLPLFSGFGTGG